MPRRTTAASAKRRFAVGASVLVKNPGVKGVVIQIDDEPTVMWEYWHTIKTEDGERKEPGCNLELVPRPISDSEPERSAELAQNIHFHGDNARLNVNSTDNSTNIASIANEQLFVQMQDTARSISNETERNEIVARLHELEKARGSGGFLQAYQNFMASAANHMTLFAPFLPMLAQMLSNK